MGLRSHPKFQEPWVSCLKQQRDLESQVSPDVPGQGSFFAYGGCFCDNWKTSFLPRLIFNWRTFSRRLTARWWRQWAKIQVSTNQTSRNRWCQIVRDTVCMCQVVVWTDKRNSTIAVLLGIFLNFQNCTFSEHIRKNGMKWLFHRRVDSK